jgi:RNase H-like domain found in reverse transcriptase
MFPKRSHILAPLTALVGGKGALFWTTACQQAFDAMKALLAKDAFLRYPDHNKRFDIYCDASDLQLGAVITQEDRPVAYYSRKLNSAQRNYTVGEKEILSVVETLKEYRNMLYGCPNIHVHTDHKNNTFHRLQTQRVLRWRLFLEDYNVQFHYIKEKTTLLQMLYRVFPFQRGRIRVIQQIYQQDPLHLSRVAMILRFHQTNQLLTMHCMITISSIVSSISLQRRTSLSSWPSRRLLKRKLGTPD